jgi:hypothetical protein
MLQWLQPSKWILAPSKTARSMVPSSVFGRQISSSESSGLNSCYFSARNLFSISFIVSGGGNVVQNRRLGNGAGFSDLTRHKEKPRVSQ